MNTSTKFLFTVLFFSAFCLEVSAQSDFWTTVPVYHKSTETFNSSGRLTYYNDGLPLGEPDLNLLRTEDQTTPFSTVLKLYNAQSKRDLEGVYFHQSLLDNKSDEQIKRQFEQRETEVDIYLESVLEHEDLEGTEWAFIKLWLRKKDTKQQVFILKVLIKEKGIYKVATANLIRGLGIAFLSVKTNVLLAAINGNEKTLPIKEGGSVSLIKFSSIVNEWLSNEETSDTNQNLQNLGW